LEQERRDRELALRLVAEDQSMVEDIQTARSFSLLFYISTCTVIVCTKYLTAGVGKRVRRKCGVVHKPHADRIDYDRIVMAVIDRKQ